MPTREDRRAAVQQWLRPELWPPPKWLGDDMSQDRAANFEELSRKQLQARYGELEGDFRSVVENYSPADMPTTKCVFDYLQALRPALEQKRPDLMLISHTLNLVERYMVWLYPPHVLEVRIQTTLLRLEQLRPAGGNDILTGCKYQPLRLRPLATRRSLHATIIS